MFKIQEMSKVARNANKIKKYTPRYTGWQEYIYQMLKANYVESGRSEYWLWRFAIYTGDGWMFDHPDARKILRDHYGSLSNMPYQALCIYAVQDILQYGGPIDDCLEEINYRIEQNDDKSYLYLLCKRYETVDDYPKKAMEFIEQSYLLKPTLFSIYQMLKQGVYKDEFNDYYKNVVLNYHIYEYEEMLWLDSDEFIEINITMNQNSSVIESVKEFLEKMLG